MTRRQLLNLLSLAPLAPLACKAMSMDPAPPKAPPKASPPLIAIERTSYLSPDGTKRVEFVFNEDGSACACFYYD
jgi:hypothetical protein